MGSGLSSSVQKLTRMLFKLLITRLLGAAITVISVNASPAADISVEAPVPGGPTRIVINGSMNLDDADQFIQKAEVSNAIVSFNSEAGNLLAGFLIGQTIREKKFATAVKRGDQCASACGLAWLAGSRRFLEPGARIGFRAARDSAELGNAVLKGYLNELELSAPAKAYITEAPPKGMKWLDNAQAAKLGIAISAWSAALPPKLPEVSSESLWHYDGSTLLLMTDGVQRKIYYDTPRPELVKMGIQRGTLFFVGRQQGREYRGIALAFSSRCVGTPYRVRGELSEDNQTIVMRGKAPSLLDAKCRIVDTYESTALLVRSEEQPSDPVSSISPRP